MPRSQRTSNRTLTVLRGKWDGRLATKDRASSLFLNGQWLKAWGFHSGHQVAVTQLQSGVIELRVCSPVQLRDPDFTVACQRLDKVLS